MKIINSIKIVSLALIVASTLNATGCSSGGGGGTASTPNGIYTGDITGGNPSFNSDIQGGEKAIIYNGRFMLLSEQSSGIGQIFDANFSITGTSLSGNGFRYDNISLLNNATYDGDFIENQSASINFTKSGVSSANLPDGTINLTVSSTLLSKGSATSKLEGTWAGDFGADFFGKMTLVFDVNGNISLGSIDEGNPGSTLDCSFTGSVLPADTSINVYNVNLTSDGGSGPFNCTLPAGNYPGLAWTEGDTDGTLIFMVSNGTNSRAVILTKN